MRHSSILLPALTALILSCSISPVHAAGPEGNEKLAHELKQVFGKWSQAMKEKDRTLWEQTTARYRQIGIRNMIVSQKKNWPGALFESPVSPPDVSDMQLARTMVKGVTAQLVYFGRPDFGVEEDTEVPDGLLFLMFIKEKGGWKFSTSRFMSLNGAGEIAAAAQKGDYTFLDTAQFAPPGRVPPLPRLCPRPEIVGYIEIVSIGYQTHANIADRSQHTVIDNVHKALIIGGLKAGINQVFVEAKPLPVQQLEPGQKPRKQHFEFSIYRQSSQPDQPLKRIYHSGENTEPGRFKVIVRGDS
ncbi:MAG: hypothetical protein VYB61_11985 [Verrucomicrobiota bacterium]|nr:hypothetical protein [Verrucomicrobiota bacterium]